MCVLARAANPFTPSPTTLLYSFIFEHFQVFTFNAKENYHCPRKSPRLSLRSDCPVVSYSHVSWFQSMECEERCRVPLLPIRISYGHSLFLLLRKANKRPGHLKATCGRQPSLLQTLIFLFLLVFNEDQTKELGHIWQVVSQWTVPPALNLNEYMKDSYPQLTYTVTWPRGKHYCVWANLYLITISLSGHVSSLTQLLSLCAEVSGPYHPFLYYPKTTTTTKVELET